jgi:membrane protease YdiL (CAAX protease family)
LSFGKKPKELLISLGVVVFLTCGPTWRIDYHHWSFARIFELFIFALSIGVDEELFSRGFIFGALERYGIWLAATVSSIHFGLLHLGNIAWGGQSAAYTLAQVVDAASFGFLAAGLMVFSGSIWVPILMHGLTDFPMQFDSKIHYTKLVTGGADWLSVAGDFVIYSAIGAALIILSDPVKQSQVKKFLLS